MGVSGQEGGWGLGWKSERVSEREQPLTHVSSSASKFPRLRGLVLRFDSQHLLQSSCLVKIQHRGSTQHGLPIFDVKSPIVTFGMLFLTYFQNECQKVAGGGNLNVFRRRGGKE